jgi:hypothetical protein
MLILKGVPVRLNEATLPAMNANSHLINRKALLWPVVGLAIGAFVSTNLFHMQHITIQAGIAAWWASMLIVLTLSAHPVGARVGVVIAGLFTAIPCFVDYSSLARCLLICFMGIPLIFGTAMVISPPIGGFRSRLRHLCSWFDTRRVECRPRSVDTVALQSLIIATAVLGAAMVVLTATPEFGFWILVRWLAGGVAIFAVAEVATAVLPLMGAALGVDVPPLFQSPYRSTSVNEFWTKRWNIPASEIFRRYSFAPIARRNIALALFATFVISAIAHVLLTYVALGRWGISLVCGSFFLVQPIVITAERTLAVRRWPKQARWAWTLIALAITAPLIIEPLLQILHLGPAAPVNVLVATLAVVGFLTFFSGIVALTSLASLPADTEAYKT